MMKIGIVSDTHSLELPDQMMKDFETVDLIVHAGDFCSQEDYELFTEIKDVKAVHGNMDDSTLRSLLPRSQILEIEGSRIGLFHGEGPPQGLIDVIKDEFRDEQLDVIIFGHSHKPLNEKIDNVLFFNPGSPNDIISAPYCSYGMIEINNGKIKAKIIKV